MNSVIKPFAMYAQNRAVYNHTEKYEKIGSLPSRGHISKHFIWCCLDCLYTTCISKWKYFIHMLSSTYIVRKYIHQVALSNSCRTTKKLINSLLWHYYQVPEFMQARILTKLSLVCLLGIKGGTRWVTRSQTTVGFA